MAQFHENPCTYLTSMRAAVAHYDEFEGRVAAAVAQITPKCVLDLGSGTGETASRILQHLPSSRLVGIDASQQMVELASGLLPQGDFRLGRLEWDLPGGTFDAVVSALAVHHLGPAEKADLFKRVASKLSPGGRFVLGDVIVPEHPNEQVTPLDAEVDRPDALADQLDWLVAAGLSPHLVWSIDDLVVVAADKAD